MAINLDKMLGGYRECAAWADCGPDHETYEREWSAELDERMRTDCKKFIARIDATLPAFLADLAEHCAGYSDERFGQDFWLTRNGHGAGYWDRKELEAKRPFDLNGDTFGRVLSDAANHMGPCELYVGDDGLVYAC